MKFIPVDTSRLQVLVVGPPKPQMKDGQPQTDRDSGRPMWNIDVTVIGEARAETVQLGVPEGGFPKDLGIGAFIIPEGWVAIQWENPNRHGMFQRATSVKVAGGSAGAKGAAA